MTSQPNLERMNEIVNNRVQTQISHEKLTFYFEAKTTLPKDQNFKLQDTTKLLNYYTQILYQSQNEKELSKNYHLRGSIYFDSFDYYLALNDFLEAEKFDKENSVLYYDIACVHVSLDDKEKYLSYLLKSLEIDPDFVYANENLSYYYHMKEDYDKALYYLEKCIKKDPYYLSGYKSIAFVYSELDNKQKQKEYYQKIIDIHENKKSEDHMTASIAYHEYANILYYDEENTEKAFLYYDKSISIFPHFSLNWFSRGVLHVEKEQYTEAIYDFTKCIEFKKSNAYEYRAHCYEKLERYELALEDMSTYLELSSDIWCYMKIGELYFLMKQFDMALIHFDTFHQNSPTTDNQFLKLLIEDCLDELSQEEEDEASDEY
eukprot:gene7318-11637_t